MNSDFSKLTNEERELRLTALLLGELEPAQAEETRQAIATDAELAREYERLKQTIALVRETTAMDAGVSAEGTPLKLDDERRQKLLAMFKTPAPRQIKPRRRRKLWFVPMSIAAVLVGLLTVSVTELADIGPWRRAREKAAQARFSGLWGNGTKPYVTGSYFSDLSSDGSKKSRELARGGEMTAEGGKVVTALEDAAAADIRITRGLRIPAPALKPAPAPTKTPETVALALPAVTEVEADGRVLISGQAMPAGVVVTVSDSGSALPVAKHSGVNGAVSGSTPHSAPVPAIITSHQSGAVVTDLGVDQNSARGENRFTARDLYLGDGEKNETAGVGQARPAVTTPADAAATANSTVGTGDQSFWWKVAPTTEGTALNYQWKTSGQPMPAPAAQPAEPVASVFSADAVGYANVPNAAGFKFSFDPPPGTPSAEPGATVDFISGTADPAPVAQLQSQNLWITKGLGTDSGGPSRAVPIFKISSPDQPKVNQQIAAATPPSIAASDDFAGLDNPSRIAMPAGSQPPSIILYATENADPIRTESVKLVQDGKFYYESGRLREAEKALKQAATLDPENKGAAYFQDLVNARKNSAESRLREVNSKQLLLEIDRESKEADSKSGRIAAQGGSAPTFGNGSGGQAKVVNDSRVAFGNRLNNAVRLSATGAGGAVPANDRDGDGISDAFAERFDIQLPAQGSEEQLGRQSSPTRPVSERNVIARGADNTSTFDFAGLPVAPQAAAGAAPAVEFSFLTLDGSVYQATNASVAGFLKHDDAGQHLHFLKARGEPGPAQPAAPAPLSQGWGSVVFANSGTYLISNAVSLAPRGDTVQIIEKANAASSETPTLWGRISGALSSDVKRTARISVEQDAPDVDARARGVLTHTTTDPYFSQTEVERIQSKEVLGKVVEKLKLDETWSGKQGGGKKLSTDDAVAKLQKMVETKSDSKTSLIDIGVKSRDPAEAARIANTIAEVYRETRTEQRAQLVSNFRAALQKELAAQDKQVAGDWNELLRPQGMPRTNRFIARLAMVVTNGVLPDLSSEPQTAPAKPAAPAPTPQPEVLARDNAFSTFSLNVSDVSFKLAAASLEKGAMPDVASIRSEEFLNAFDYRDPMPAAGVPIAFAWERARYPFAHNRDALWFSVKTAAQGRESGKPLNIVLLLDNSGSMERADRVRIIQESLRSLVAQLKPQDKLSVVTFARTATLRVDGASGAQAAEVANQIGALTPEGGTNLEDALDLAYRTALRHYAATAVNRVVLLTDGAANLGNVEPASLKTKVENFRKQGVALDCFGIGWEGFNDDLLEQLSRNGDGRYGFVNTPEEAASEFVGQLAGALHVAASDVKVQVEFNPKRVTAYRQIGYAKHQLTKQQFRDNTVDAAEIGAAEAGNGLYIIETNPRGEGPIATVRARFRIPQTSDYREHEWVVPFGSAVDLEQSSSAMRLATSASAFSEWLASSPFAGEVTTDRLLGILSGVPEVYGADPRPKKLEWMIRQAKSISGK